MLAPGGLYKNHLKRCVSVDIWLLRIELERHVAPWWSVQESSKKMCLCLYLAPMYRAREAWAPWWSVQESSKMMCLSIYGSYVSSSRGMWAPGGLCKNHLK